MCLLCSPPSYGNISSNVKNTTFAKLASAQEQIVSPATVASGPEKPRIGYLRVSPETGNTTPAGVAIFGFRNDGILVSEAVPASAPIGSGRIYVDINGPVSTGIAIASSSGQDAVISFYFTGSKGNNFGAGSSPSTHLKSF
jgi:hypothetical protein